MYILTRSHICLHLPTGWTCELKASLLPLLAGDGSHRQLERRPSRGPMAAPLPPQSLPLPSTPLAFVVSVLPPSLSSPLASNPPSCLVVGVIQLTASRPFIHFTPCFSACSRRYGHIAGRCRRDIFFRSRCWLCLRPCRLAALRTAPPPFRWICPPGLRGL